MGVLLFLPSLALSRYIPRPSLIILCPGSWVRQTTCILHLAPRLTSTRHHSLPTLYSIHIGIESSLFLASPACLQTLSKPPFLIKSLLGPYPCKAPLLWLGTLTWRFSISIYKAINYSAWLLVVVSWCCWPRSRPDLDAWSTLSPRCRAPAYLTSPLLVLFLFLDSPYQPT